MIPLSKTNKIILFGSSFVVFLSGARKIPISAKRMNTYYDSDSFHRQLSPHISFECIVSTDPTHPQYVSVGDLVRGSISILNAGDTKVKSAIIDGEKKPAYYQDPSEPENAFASMTSFSGQRILSIPPQTVTV
jgi:hypothetical protein